MLKMMWLFRSLIRVGNQPEQIARVAAEELAKRHVCTQWNKCDNPLTRAEARKLLCVVLSDWN